MLGLTHWGRVTHICVSKLSTIGSDNGLSPDRRQAIIWTNAGLLSIEPLQTYFSENWIKMQPFSLKKMHLKMSSAKWRPSCLGLNVLNINHVVKGVLGMSYGNLLRVIKESGPLKFATINKLHNSEYISSVVGDDLKFFMWKGGCHTLL